ncbi:MAG TPA: hypothetical protein VND70_10540 [Acidimicrobiales bacterium]|nr:hypothetical protein [Acidimicrobiales bacterium]
MGKELKQKAKMLACGLGVGAVLAIPAVSVLPVAAGADNTCYTGCSSSSSGVTDANGQGLATPSTSAGSASLAFTGADLGEMALIGVGAVGAGTLLVLRSRRRLA